MARQIKNYLRGTIGPLSFRTVNGVQHISLKTPKGERKQTQPTLRTANTFGMASGLGGQLRKALKRPIGDLSDGTMVSRLNSKLIQALNETRDPETRRFGFNQESFSQLNGFDFNLKSPFAKSLGTESVLRWEAGNLNVRCGAPGEPLKLTFPAKSSSCDVIIAVALFRLDEGTRTFEPLKQRITVAKNEPYLQGIDLNFEVPAGCFYVAAIFLKYYNSAGGREILLNSKTFSPGAILLAQLAPGTYDTKDHYQWTLMYRLCFEYLPIVAAY